MMKKITLIILIFFSVISCGKKGDPEYKGNSMIQGQKITI